jgi:hypothetical protein
MNGFRLGIHDGGIYRERDYRDLKKLSILLQNSTDETIEEEQIHNKTNKQEVAY